MSEFRDSIAELVAAEFINQDHYMAADTILAMPEMQAIRAVLLDRARRYEWCGPDFTTDTREVLHAMAEDAEYSDCFPGMEAEHLNRVINWMLS